MTLTQFAAAGKCLGVQVPWLRDTLWFAPDDNAVDNLRTDGIRRGRIWSVRELRFLMCCPNISHQDVVAISRAKLATNAVATDVEVAEPSKVATRPARRSQADRAQTRLDLGPPPTEHDR